MSLNLHVVLWKFYLRSIWVIFFFFLNWRWHLVQTGKKNRRKLGKITLEETRTACTLQTGRRRQREWKGTQTSKTFHPPKQPNMYLTPWHLFWGVHSQPNQLLPGINWTHIFCLWSQCTKCYVKSGNLKTSNYSYTKCPWTQYYQKTKLI